jgi:hypothetical protein
MGHHQASCADQRIKQRSDEFKVHILLQLGPGVGVFHAGKLRLVGHPAHGRPGNAAQVHEGVAQVYPFGEGGPQVRSLIFKSNPATIFFC